MKVEPNFNSQNCLYLYLEIRDSYFFLIKCFINLKLKFEIEIDHQP